MATDPIGEEEKNATNKYGRHIFQLKKRAIITSAKRIICKRKGNFFEKRNLWLVHLKFGIQKLKFGTLNFEFGREKEISFEKENPLIGRFEI